MAASSRPLSPGPPWVLALAPLLLAQPLSTPAQPSQPPLLLVQSHHNPPTFAPCTCPPHLPS